MMIVLLSIGGIVLDELATSNFSLNPTIIRVMRVLRITRGNVCHIISHYARFFTVVDTRMVLFNPLFNFLCSSQALESG